MGCFISTLFASCLSYLSHGHNLSSWNSPSSVLFVRVCVGLNAGLYDLLFDFILDCIFSSFNSFEQSTPCFYNLYTWCLTLKWTIFLILCDYLIISNMCLRIFSSSHRRQRPSGLECRPSHQKSWCGSTWPHKPRNCFICLRNKESTVQTIISVTEYKITTV